MRDIIGHERPNFAIILLPGCISCTVVLCTYFRECNILAQFLGRLWSNETRLRYLYATRLMMLNSKLIYSYIYAFDV